MQKQIRTTGDLRKFLAEISQAVRDGTIELNKANTLVKLASQINQSFMTDVQVAKTYLLSNKMPIVDGELYLGNKDEAREIIEHSPNDPS